MESDFGFDFRDVRIHNNSKAAQSASAVGALAYTFGTHIVFGAGQYTPQTGAHRRLLAHELAHVVQQTGTGDLTSVKGSAEQALASEDSPLEVEARQIEAGDAGVHPVRGRVAKPAIQRKKTRDRAGRYGGQVEVIWSNYSAEFHRRLVTTIATHFGIRAAALVQPSYEPALRFHYQSENKTGDRLKVYVEFFHDPESFPEVSDVRLEKVVVARASDSTPSASPRPVIEPQGGKNTVTKGEVGALIPPVGEAEPVTKGEVGGKPLTSDIIEKLLTTPLFRKEDVSDEELNAWWTPEREKAFVDRAVASYEEILREKDRIEIEAYKRESSTLLGHLGRGGYYRPLFEEAPGGPPQGPVQVAELRRSLNIKRRLLAFLTPADRMRSLSRAYVAEASGYWQAFIEAAGALAAMDAGALAAMERPSAPIPVPRATPPRAAPSFAEPVIARAPGKVLRIPLGSRGTPAPLDPGKERPITSLSEFRQARAAARLPNLPQEQGQVLPKPEVIPQQVAVGAEGTIVTPVTLSTTEAKAPPTVAAAGEGEGVGNRPRLKQPKETQSVASRTRKAPTRAFQEQEPPRHLRLKEAHASGEGTEELQATTEIHDPAENRLEAYAGQQLEKIELPRWKRDLGPAYKFIARKQFSRIPWLKKIFPGNNRPDMIAINRQENKIIVGDVTSNPNATKKVLFARHEEIPHGEATKDYARRLASSPFLPDEYKDFTVVAQEYWTDLQTTSREYVVPKK
jgi:hypothetical protein